MRLPKEVAFGADVELVVVRAGDVITLYPAGLSVSEMADKLSAMPAPPAIEQRDLDELPERLGL
ncbi:MAG: hypothetical protein JNM59_11215 [Hyphomonadaceae bacterium]|nr:hypothetical protein [Hyphomonadaceae bacterium]